VAADGELLISAGMPRAARPLTAALRPDPAAALPAETVVAVLNAIGLDDPGAFTAVSADGTWRNGPLRGRHAARRARHIGAAARAAHRLERIRELDAELGVLARQASERAQARAELDTALGRIDALVRAAPRSADLHAARRVAAAAVNASHAQRRPGRRRGRERPPAAHSLGGGDDHPPRHVRAQRASRPIRRVSSAPSPPRAGHGSAARGWPTS